MSKDLTFGGGNAGTSGTIVAISNPVEDFASSEMFARLFQDGMAMVEETAAYLDGPGRAESKGLPRKVALAYAGESMRLTTRLMQVASWLLVQRAVKEGEMSVGEASEAKYRLGAQEICRGPGMESADLLPERLLELLVLSGNLYDRVDRLDKSVYSQTETAQPAAVSQHFDRLEQAFGAVGRDS